MIVYITRHGQPWLSSTKDGGDPEYPPGDPPLSALGRDQARLLGARLRAIGFSGSILASPYWRTAETANLVAEELGATFRVEAAIREIVKVPEQMAAFRGLAVAELRATFPRLAPDATLGYPWWTTEAETSEMVLARVGQFLRARHPDEGDVLLVGHGASVSACIRYFLNPYPDVLARVENNWNCGLTGIQVAPHFKPLLLADTAHLAPDQVTSNAKTRGVWLRERQAAKIRSEQTWDLTQ